MTMPAACAALLRKESRSSFGKTVPCWTLLFTTAALLAGCASTPLPIWPAAPTPAQQPAHAPSLPSQGSLPAASPLPYSQAVGQRFPNPAVTYQTPGLQDGRNQFTSNAELNALLKDLAQQTLGKSPRLGLIHIGNSQGGQPIHALMATKAEAIGPDAIDQTGLPTLMVVAGQQGTDTAPTEALLVIAQSLAPGGNMHSMLQRANILLVPRANPDGFDKQTSVTANGTPLTTDHLSLSTPEARSLAKLVLQYHPDVVLNTEEFNAIQPTLQQFGAIRANDAGLHYGLTSNVHEFVVNAQTKWLHRALTDQLPKTGQRVDWAYQASSSDKMLHMATSDPVSLINVSALKNIPSVTVQSRGADIGHTHIQRRMHTHVTAITAALNETIAHAQDLEKVRSFVSRDIASQACKGNVTVSSSPTQSERTVVMLDPQSGADVNVRAPWISAQQLRSTLQRPRPCGYWLSAQNDQAVEKLRLLGVQVQRIAESSPVASDRYALVNGRISTARTPLDAEPNSFYVTLNQPLANVAVAALEPDNAFSFARQGIVRNLEHIARVMAPAGFVFEED